MVGLDDLRIFSKLCEFHDHESEGICETILPPAVLDMAERIL